MTDHALQMFGTELIVTVSDLHLGAGRGAPESLGASLELFDHDAEFAGIVNFFRERMRLSDRRLRLIILGDFLDFPRVPGFPGKNRDSDSASVEKLKQIVRGHPLVFEALQGIVADGHQIDLLPGNHDIQLMRPTIQVELMTTLQATGTGLVQFHPWILHVPGLLYAEHGNQYHDINSFPALLQGMKLPVNRIPRPLGVLFDNYLVSLAEMISARTTLGQVTIKGITGALASNPALFVRAIPTHVRFAILVASRFASQPALRRGNARRRYRRVLVDLHAAEINLPASTLSAIDEIAEEVALGFPYRFRRGIGSVIRRRLGSGSRTPFKGDTPGFPSSPAERSTTLHHIARSIDEALSASNQQVPFYIFGHTHIPDDSTVHAGEHDLRCLNAGSWTNPAATEQNSQTKPQFTFLEIESSAGFSASARLMVWDDQTHRAEPFQIQH